MPLELVLRVVREPLPGDRLRGGSTDEGHLRVGLGDLDLCQRAEAGEDLVATLGRDVRAIEALILGLVGDQDEDDAELAADLIDPRLRGRVAEIDQDVVGISSGLRVLAVGDGPTVVGRRTPEVQTATEAKTPRARAPCAIGGVHVVDNDYRRKSLRARDPFPVDT